MSSSQPRVTLPPPNPGDNCAIARGLCDRLDGGRGFLCPPWGGRDTAHPAPAVHRVAFLNREPLSAAPRLQPCTSEARPHPSRWLRSSRTRGPSVSFHVPAGGVLAPTRPWIRQWVVSLSSVNLVQHADFLHFKWSFSHLSTFVHKYIDLIYQFK